MTSAVVNGVELYYETAGTGECVVLTHGSWTDGSGWAPAVERLADRYRVVVWDRRGHSRSGAGDGPGSRAEDAADLAGLIEHVSDERVHVVGSSYGGNVTLTLVTQRPDLVATAMVHEPPLFGLLEGVQDQAVLDELASSEAELGIVRDALSTGSYRAAAEHFIEHVALGPGSWAELPDSFRSVLEANAPTFLDELADETALSIDGAALAATSVPLLMTHGTESPALFPAVIRELSVLVPAGRVAVIDGAGHIPHVTHPDEWAALLVEATSHRSHA
ncbi:MAG TPA: alpha/beta hydrolase [Acidimicrobiales bacterium]